MPTVSAESSQVGPESTTDRETGVGRLRCPVSDTALNGMQVRPRPLWRQLEQGKVPLQRFLEARQAVQAVFALRRFAGRTFGRGMFGLYLR